MLVYDSHCHLEAADSTSGLTLIPSINLTDIPALTAFRAKSPQYKIGFGVHPWYIQQENEKLLASQLLQAIEKFKPDFIGEIGLDYLKPNPELQQQIFICQLQLARQFNLPVIIHCVAAYNDIISILKKHKISRGIIHGFNANSIIAKEITDLGLLLGIGGTISKKSKILSSIKSIDLNKLVFESDAPFMPEFGKIHSDSTDTFLYAQIAARQLDMNLIDLINYANRNLLKLFNSA